MDLSNQYSKWLWSDWFWLPKGISFKDLQDKPNFIYAKPKHLVYMPMYAILFLILRTLYEKFVSPYFASLLNIPTRKKPPTPNLLLEETFKSNIAPTKIELKTLAKKLKWPEYRIINWFKKRRNLNRPDLTKKFAEASWRFIFYCFAFCFGMITLYQSPWFWNHIECWNDYPRQTLWLSVYYYYMIEGGFYMGLACSLLYDVKRKDFNQQIIHHCATLFLIVFSFVANFVRIGTLVMALHDVSDIFLELAKCFVYAKWKIADTLFTVFAFVFIVSRIIIFPYSILYTTLIKSMWLFSPYPGYYFFNGLLIVLWCLHLFWAYIIVSMAIRMMKVGKLEKDARSDDYESTSSESDVEKTEHLKSC